MFDINWELADSYTLIYSRAELLVALAQAVNDINSNVQITQVNFEGGGASGRAISGKPDYVHNHVKAAIRMLDDPHLPNRPSSAFMDLSNRQFGT